MKRTISLILVFLICVFSTEVSAMVNKVAETSSEVSSDEVVAQFAYKIEDGQVKITDLKYPYPSEIYVPSQIEGYPVTRIGNWALSDVDAAKIVIPDSVTTIEKEAFRWSTVETIVIPDSITSVGEKIFYDCTSLKDIQISESVLMLFGKEDFLDTSFYKNQIDNGFIYLGNTLIGYEGITPTEVVIPDGTTGIIRNAFKYASMESVIIPESVVNVGAGAFNSCQYLNKITVAENNPKYDSRDNCNAIIETATNTLIAGAGDTDIPESIVAIGEYAFYNRISLEWAYIPDSVVEIRDHAFEICSKMQGLYFGDSVEIIGDYAFSYCSELRTVELPETLVHIGDYAFEGNALWWINIPDSVITIGDYAFCCINYETSLRSIHLGNGVQKIGEMAFFNANIKEIVIPPSVTEIGESAFRCTEKLVNIVVCNPSVVIGYFALGYCVYWNDYNGLNEYYQNTRLRIYGHHGSTAYDYAFNNGCNFGEIIGTCSCCGDVLASYNTTEINMVPATCTEDGSTAGLTCNSCDAYFIEPQVIPKAGHTYGEPVAQFVTPGTCQTSGSYHEVIYCSVCNIELSRVKKFTGTIDHDTVTVWGYDATCTEDGLTDGARCTVCKEMVVEQTVIPAKGHTPVIDKQVDATCYGTGKTAGAHCEDCGYVFIKQTTIPKVPHEIVVDPEQKATCTDSGLTEGSHCDVCNEILVVQQTVPKLDHAYVIIPETPATLYGSGLTEGVQCERCGDWLIEQKVIPELSGAVVLGDVDGDTKISVMDATAIQRQLASLVELTDVQKRFADVDKDREISVMDATNIQRLVAKIIVKF